MKKLRILLIFLTVVFSLAGAGLLIFNFLLPKAGGLLIETSPASTIYINEEEVGRSPFTTLRKSGEISLRLIPDSFGQPLAPFEEKITLVSGVETVVRRFFGSSEKFSEGEILTFEKLSEKGSSGIAVISDPENIQIEIDGVSRGVTPYTSQSIGAGTHTLKFSVGGYKERSIEVNLVKGYKLIAFVELSEAEIKKEEPKVVEEKPMIQLVKILKTPTGFLRVRKEASTQSAEVGQVKPDEEYVFLSKDQSGDWYKISLDDDKDGWVTSQYSEIISKEESTASAKPQ